MKKYIFQDCFSTDPICAASYFVDDFSGVYVHKSYTNNVEYNKYGYEILNLKK